jgi:lipopolysaccharide export system permease protein
MLKTFQFYLISLFLKKILTVSLVFFSLVIILSIFDEISFFKDLDLNFFYPFFITILNAPSALFEIFPFIFLIATQFFFISLINKNELELLKVHSLNNMKIIKLLFFTSLILGLFLVILFYNFSSKLKFIYLDLKNNYSTDNKYLAVVTENGLWVKDEIDNKIYIVNASYIEKNFLKNVSITEFSEEFNLIQILQSSTVDISNKEWIIINPIISRDNQTTKLDKNIKIKTHFDQKKINSLFRSLSSLNIFELTKLINDYNELGYSTSAIESHLNKLFSFPVYLSIMTIFSAVIMLNIKKNKPIIFHLILGILLSVFIYFFYYLFNLLGENGKIPIIASVWLPFLILIIFILIGLVRINEK